MNKDQKIDKFALDEYTADKYPKLFEQVGLDGLVAIQEHNKDAADIVSKLSGCDVVVYVGHSSETDYPSKIVSFVECKNGKRFYVENRKIKS